MVRAEERARTEARLRARAEAAEQAGRGQLYTALLEQARALVRSGELGHRTRALDALRRAVAITNAVELRREVFAALALPDLQNTGELALESDTTLVALDPTFSRVATGRGLGPVIIRATTNETILATLPASTNLPAIIGEWSRDGRWLVVVRNHPAGEMRALELWDVTEFRCARTWPAVRFGSFALSPDGQRLAVGAADQSVVLHSLSGGEPDQVLPLSGPAVQMQFAPDGGRLAVVTAAAQGQLVSVYNRRTGAAEASHRCERPLGAIDWHPQGRWIALPDHGGNVNLWEWPTGTVRSLGRHKAQAARASFTADGRYLVSGGWERELTVWDLKAMRRIFNASLDGFHLQFAGDGQRCALFQVTARRLGFFEFTPAMNHRELPEDLGSLVRHATFSPDGRWLAASGHERLAVWDLRQETPAALVNELTGARMAFTPNSEALYASDDTNTLRWRLVARTNGPPGLESLPFPEPAGFTSVGADANALYITSPTGTQRFPGGNLNRSAENGRSTTNGLNGVSPDGKWLGIYQPYGRTLHVYRLPEIELAAELPHPGSIGGFAFSPAGDEVGVCSRNQVGFWRLGTWERLRTLTNFNRLLYQPDGRGWWLARDHREAGLYDPQTLDLRLPLPLGMIPLAISPDGRRLVVSLDAQRLQLWDIGEVRRQLRQLGMDWEATTEAAPRESSNP